MLGTMQHALYRTLATLLAILTPWAGLTAGADPPAGYYNPVDPTNASTLRRTLHDLIDDHKRLPYTANATDTWDVLEAADQHPSDDRRILDIYRNASHLKAGGGNANYNREHSWPKSYGFPKLNVENYPYTDCHHLFLVDSRYNSSRHNKLYQSCDESCTEKPTENNEHSSGESSNYPGSSNWTRKGVWETWIGRRGDVARALFYMDVRYEGGMHGVTAVIEPDLILTDNPSLVESSTRNQAAAHMGRLSDLLQWHSEDPVDERERHHNEAVFEAQGNRNPFVDRPEWVLCVFRDECSGSLDESVDVAVRSDVTPEN